MYINPLVSVVIPTYNRPEYICRAIDSCFSQVDVNVEVIVVDDNGLGSEAQKAVEKMLMGYAQKENFLYIPHERNKNGAAARNTGIRASKGKFIAFLDDDDWFEPWKISKQLAKMADDNTKACLCGFRRLYGEETVEGNPDNKDLSYRILLGNVDSCAGSGLIVEKQLALDINGFQENFVRRQDVEFLYRVSKRTDVSVVKEMLLNVFMHSGNLKKNHSKDIAGVLSFLDSFKADIDSYPRRKRDAIWDANYLELSKLELKDKHILKSLKWLYKSPHKFKNLSLLVNSAISFYNRSSRYNKV